MVVVSSISSLLSGVILDAPGVSSDHAARALRLSARELIRDSEIWREELAVTTVADQASYTLTTSETDALIHRIEWVKYDTSTDNLDERQYYLDMENVALVFETAYVPSTSALAMTVKVILVPEYQAETIPTWILERYHDGIIAGAVARLQGEDRQVWSSPEQSAKHRRVFLSSLSEARMDRERRGTQRRMETEA